MVNTQWVPSDDYSGLTTNNLIDVGTIIRRARNEAADDHRPEAGETNWTLGVSGFERTCFALTTESQRIPWLEIAAGAGGGPVHFIMRIGGHPIRFYRGDPDDVPMRYRQRSIPELFEQQKSLALNGGLQTGRSLRIAIENDSAGRPSGIYLVEMDSDGETVSMYQIPGAAGNVTPFVPPVPPVEIGPVFAEPIADHLDEQVSSSGDE